MEAIEPEVGTRIAPPGSLQAASTLIPWYRDPAPDLGDYSSVDWSDPQDDSTWSRYGLTNNKGDILACKMSNRDRCRELQVEIRQLIFRINVLLRKANGWGYEREWRLIDEQGVQDSPLLMKEIMFRLRCPPSVKHAVVCALEGRDKPVRFYEIYEVRSRYVLQRRPLEFDEPSWLPRTATSGVEMFGPLTEEEGK